MNIQKKNRITHNITFDYPYNQRLCCGLSDLKKYSLFAYAKIWNSQAACHANMDGSVTRNIKDYKKSNLPVYNPAELISFLNGRDQ
jgi:hypothetical protein